MQSVRNRPLSRDKDGKLIPEVKGASHTQLGRKRGRKGQYPQAREFDVRGKEVRRIDFTNHGKPLIITQTLISTGLGQIKQEGLLKEDQLSLYLNGDTMETKGIRILDKKDGVLSVKLADLFEEIKNPHQFNWAILLLDVVFIPEVKDSSVELYNKIEKSEGGVYITWKELKLLHKDILLENDLLIMACKDKVLLKKHAHMRELYEKFDLALDLIDCTFWEVFSKDLDLIDRLFKKFKDTQVLNLDNFDKV